MSEDLKLKYRPQTLGEFYGGEDLVDALQAYTQDEGRSHSILLFGPSGCGKTTLGRIISKMLGSNLTKPNFLEFDLAADGGVDAAKKKIVQTCRYMPIARKGEAKIKIYLLDESHLLTRQGASALLKTIEEPPPFVYFIFATTDPQKMLDTILTRCVKFEVKNLPDDDMEGLLADVSDLEHISISRSVQRKIIRIAEGCPRDALGYLSQVRSLSEETALNILTGGVKDNEVNVICQILLDPRRGNKWADMRSSLENFSEDSSSAEKARVGILKYLRKVVLNPKTSQGQLQFIDNILPCFWSPFDRNGKSGLVLSLMSACMISGGE